MPDTEDGFRDVKTVIHSFRSQPRQNLATPFMPAVRIAIELNAEDGFRDGKTAITTDRSQPRQNLARTFVPAAGEQRAHRQRQIDD